MEVGRDSLEWTEPMRKIRYVWEISDITRCMNFKSNSFPDQCATNQHRWILSASSYTDANNDLRITVYCRQVDCRSGNRDVSGFYGIEITNADSERLRKGELSELFGQFELTFDKVNATGPTRPLTITCTIVENILKPRISMKDMLTSNGFETDVVVQLMDSLGPKDIRCHQLVLALSPVFKQALQEDTKEKMIDLRHVYTGTALDLIHYLYHGIAPNIFYTCATLFPLSDLHSMNELKDQCQFHLEQKLTVENAAEYLQMAHTYKGAYLKKRCVLFIKSHYDRVRSTRGWGNLPKELLGSCVDLFMP